MQDETEALPPTDWDAVRRDYELTKLPVIAIAEKHHTTTRSIYLHVDADGWHRRSAPRTIDREGIIIRLFRLLARQTIRLELDMKDVGEKEVALLGKLAATLEKLIDIEKAASLDKPKPKPTATKDMTALRDELAERIAQLKRG